MLDRGKQQFFARQPCVSCDKFRMADVGLRKALEEPRRGRLPQFWTTRQRLTDAVQVDIARANHLAALPQLGVDFGNIRRGHVRPALAERWKVGAIFRPWHIRGDPVRNFADAIAVRTGDRNLNCRHRIPLKFQPQADNGTGSSKKSVRRAKAASMRQRPS